MKVGLLVLLASLSLQAENITAVFPQNEGARKPKKAPIAGSCAFFGGTWEGSCMTSQGVRYRIKTNIEQQGCDKVTWDASAAVRDLVTENYSGKGEKASSSTTLDWNYDQTALRAVTTTLKRETGSSYVEGSLSYMSARVRPGGEQLFLQGRSASLAFGVHPAEVTVDFDCYLNLR